MGGDSSTGNDDFQKAPLTTGPNASVHERPGVTQLSGVFVPSCQNGTVIYPNTTQKNPTTRRRMSVVPPAPSTTLNCSLLSQRGDETMDWIPQASPEFRRSSRCMSMEETSTYSHCPKSVEELAGKTEPMGVSDESNNRPLSETLDSCFAQDGVRPEKTASTATAQPASTAGTIPPRETDIPAICPREPCQYVLDDSQVQGLVEIVFQEMCKHDASSQSAPATRSYQATGDSVLKWLSRKPSCLKSSIKPRPSTTAGPATTISEPETSFFARSASDGQVYSKTRSQQAPATTIVSQVGSTDILWRDNMGTGPGLPQCTSPVLDTSTDKEPCRAPRSAVAREAPDLLGFSIEPQPPSRTSEDKENIKELIIEDKEEKDRGMTSFPALSKRHCTNDWLSPPTSFVDSEDVTDMYHLGIDARSGSIASINRGLTKYHVEDAKSHKDPRLRPLQSNPETVVGMQPCEMGDSLLASAESGRRRSAHFADPPTPEHPKSKPGFMQKLTRKISSVFQHPDSISRPTRAPPPSEVEGQISGKSTEALGATRPPAGDGGPDNGHLSEPEPDTVYQAMTLLKPSKGEPQRRNTCSEDNIPHRCEDDLSTSGMPTPCAQPSP
ncbi:hypothetical protein LZ30DRAFT_766223 [Colletotrichum cereale]|nr:hypothetical protein LZ30DRAFT_766223 [Colletotrichum cereale]